MYQSHTAILGVCERVCSYVRLTPKTLLFPHLGVYHLYPRPPQQYGLPECFNYPCFTYASLCGNRAQGLRSALRWPPLSYRMSRTQCLERSVTFKDE